MVQNMLDSHPLVLGGPEFLHLKDFMGLRQKLFSSISLEWIDIICSRDDVDSQLTEWIHKLFLPLAEKHRCEFYSEKSPDNILVFSDLLELFPQSHFIQIIRDPRAILSSFMQVKKRAVKKGIKPPWFTANTSTSITYIKTCFSSGNQACQNAPEKVLNVNYEQLIADPETNTKRICDHLGISWDDHMLRPGEKEHIGVQAITVKSNELWYDSKSYGQNINTRYSEKWRRELPMLQQLRATMAFSDNKDLAQYGYDFSIAGLARGHRLGRQVIIYSLSFIISIERTIRIVIRNIPGSSFLKKGLKTFHRVFHKKA